MEWNKQLLRCLSLNNIKLLLRQVFFNRNTAYKGAFVYKVVLQFSGNTVVSENTLVLHTLRCLGKTKAEVS